MSTQWNPHATATAGIEWFPTRQYQKALTSAGGVGAKVTSTAAETISALHAYLSNAGAFIGVDVYDAADVWAAGEVLGGMNRTAEDVANSVGWEQTVDGGLNWEPYKDAAHPNGYTMVNKIVAEDDSAADIEALITATPRLMRYVPTGSQLRGRAQWYMATGVWNKVTDGSSGNDPSAKRVARVEVSIVARAAVGSTPTLNSELKLGPDYYGSDGGPVHINSAWNRYVFSYYWNPATQQQWTNADIAKFLSGGVNSFGVRIDGTAGTDFRIAAVNIVFRALPERRVAAGCTYAFAGWTRWVLTNPLTGAAADWAKANATDYLFVFYASGNASGACALGGVDDAGVNGAGLTGWRGADQAIYHAMVPKADPVLNLWVPALFMEKSDTTLGADVQPYSQADAVQVYTGVGTTKQGIAAHGTLSYGNVTVLLAKPFLTPTAPLIVRMRKVSDDSQVGGDVTIDPADVVYNSAGFALVTVRAASVAALASGTAYYLQFTSASSGAAAGWRVCWAATDLIPSVDGTAVAAGTIAGSATLAGTADTLTDILSNVQTVPTAPGTLASSALTIANRPDLIRTIVPATIGYAHLTWAATSLGGTFGYYEVQRQDGSVWNTIAILTAEAATHWNNIDCVRNRSLAYRIRVVRSDGAVSDWANFPAVTVTTSRAGHVVIASDWDPTISLAFLDVSSPHSWQQLRDERVVTKQIYGRDFPVTFAPAENAGEEFTRDLLVAADDPNIYEGALTPDRAIFDDAVELFKAATVPCLAYCDGWGRRWLVSIKMVPTVDVATGAYIATVTCTQVAAAAAPVVTSSPW